jgi:DNA-binding transcriptional MerR regulator
MNRFFIGDRAKRFGLNPRTIRYYETVEILPKPKRTETGYRIYDNETIERLEFILKAKALGLKLDEIKEIIGLYEKGEIPCECTRAIIRKKIEEIDEKISDLADLKTRLSSLLKLKRHYIPRGSICPIIEKA